MEILSRTTSYCAHCGALHEACYRQDGNSVFFTVDCPQQPFQHLVSDDAALFRALREKAGFDAHAEPPGRVLGKKRFNLLPITNRCNFKCAICYASANTEQDARQLTAEEVFRIVPAVKQAGGRVLTLTGGEPTLHPDLLAIIRGVRKRGLHVNMPTNGYRIGTEPGLARSLKDSGLRAISLSFDTLREDVQRLYRNNTFIAEKIKALDNARSAGLRLVAIMTLSKYNIEEAGSVIRFLAGYAPALAIVNLQPYFYTMNRRDHNELFNRDTIVRREEIINALVRSGAVEGLTQDHFWPLPQMNMAVHPDCGAIATLASVRGRLFPLDLIVDMKKYFALLAAGGRSIRPGLFPLHLMMAGLRSVRRGSLLTVLKCLYGFITARGDHSLVVIAVEGLMDSPYQDDDRNRRCASAMWSSDGMVAHSGCLASMGMKG